MNEVEDWRNAVSAELSEMMKQAKQGLITINERKQYIEETTERYNIQVGDPLLERMADLLLAEYIGSNNRAKKDQPNAFLSETQYENRLSVEEEFKEYT